MVPPSVVKVSLTAGRAPGDWSARLFVDESRRADPRGISRGCRTLVSAVSAAVLDMALGAPLAWCSTCPEPAVYQRNGEAWCHACETNRGGTIS
jgi:hypothetical protein